MHKRFSEEFKKSAIIRVQNGESQLSVASSLGISYKTLNRWVIQAKEQMPSEKVSLSEENARLRKALKEREAEIAFLKNVGRQSNIPLNELTPRKATIAYWRSHGKYSLKSLSWF